MQNMRVSLLVLGAISIGAGCAPIQHGQAYGTAYQLGEDYGTAYYTMLESQILDPAAGRTQDPVVGLDGKAAMIAVDEYRKTFEKRDADFGRSMIAGGVQTR